MNAIKLITTDHERFRRLFRDYRQAKAGSERRGQIAREVLPMLDAHSRMEEEVFYPALRTSGDEAAQARVAESYEEHRLQDTLVTELMVMDPSTEQFAAKFKVLSESTELHMKEEEEETLPLAERVLADQLDQLGRDMAARRDQVLAAVR